MHTLVQLLHALADVSRLRLVEALCAGEATVSDLAVRLHLPQPRVSSHLALLRQAGLVAVHSQGRQRTYRVDAPRLQALFTALHALTPGAAIPRRSPSPQARREVRRDSALRQGRSCYDHLAGVVGVQLLDTLLQRGWLAVRTPETPRPQYMLTPVGHQALRARGVDVARASTARRQFAYGCLDWTERRVHLGGALGAAILEALRTAGVVQRQPSSRTLLVLTPLGHWLDVAEPEGPGEQQKAGGTKHSG
jgi:DNA-binding transcriptional ArsR family regulator